MEPIYRKYSNNLRLFKVLEEDRFLEIQIIGAKFQQFLVVAETYPERLFIQDLIARNFEGIEELTESQFNELLQDIKSSKTEIKPRQN